MQHPGRPEIHVRRDADDAESVVRGADRSRDVRTVAIVILRIVAAGDSVEAALVAACEFGVRVVDAGIDDRHVDSGASRKRPNGRRVNQRDPVRGDLGVGGMRFSDDVPPGSRLFRCKEQNVGALHPLHRGVLPHSRNLGIGEVHDERVEVAQFLDVPVGKLRGLRGGDGARAVSLHTDDVALRLLRERGKRNQEKYCRECATFHVGVLTWMGGAVYQIKNAAPEGAPRLTTCWCRGSYSISTLVSVTVGTSYGDPMSSAAVVNIEVPLILNKLV